MAVQDHGLEVLRKSGEQTTSGDPSDTYIKTSAVNDLLAGVQYDYVGIASTSTTKTFTYKTGGSGGTTTATIVLTYSDFVGGTLESVAKS